MNTQPTNNIATELALIKKLYENYSRAIDDALRNYGEETVNQILRDAKQQDGVIRKIGLAK